MRIFLTCYNDKGYESSMSTEASSPHPMPQSGKDVPRFAGLATFMRLPIIEDLSKLDIALIGLPMDGGTSTKPGARHGPRAVRDASTNLRLMHHVSHIEPFKLCRIADYGDCPVNPVDLMQTIDKVTAFYKEVHAAGVCPLSVGGDHLMTLPIFRGIAHERPVGMVHFDAHSDTADTFYGGSKYAHGTPFRRAVEEGLLDPKRTVQIGIRSTLYSDNDLAFARDHGMRVIFMEEVREKGTQYVIDEARRVVGDQPTYITFDVDSLDPAYAPGTGTPEVGGLNTFEAQQMVRGLQGLNLVGGDVVEVSPPFDPSGITSLVGANMMFEIMCVLADSIASRR